MFDSLLPGEQLGMSINIQMLGIITPGEVNWVKLILCWIPAYNEEVSTRAIEGSKKLYSTEWNPMNCVYNMAERQHCRKA